MSVLLPFSVTYAKHDTEASSWQKQNASYCAQGQVYDAGLLGIIFESFVRGQRGTECIHTPTFCGAGEVSTAFAVDIAVIPSRLSSDQRGIYIAGVYVCWRRCV